jgi:putative peptide zinc metalloprotease protein
VTSTVPATVALRPLAMRQDGTEWIVGRVGSNVFVAIPEVGIEAIRLLQEGHDVGTAARVLADRYGTDVDVASFVDGLTGLGFVERVGDQVLSDPGVPPPTWPRLRQRHVAWLQSRVTRVLAAAAVAVGLLCVATDPSVLPSRHDLLWSRHPSLVLVTTALVAWTIIGLHELAHLLTARAAGVPGKITIGTRLQFLAVQTDVTGIWTAPRAQRLTVYLAGITLDLVVASAAAATLRFTDPPRAIGGMLAGVIAVVLVTGSMQLLVFMRTDAYFLLQDVARCRNLYRDGGMYLRWLARRGRPDPSRQLPAAERRAVRAYALLLGVGTCACLTVAATVSVPVALGLLAQAVTTVWQATTPIGLLDGLAPFLLFAFNQTLFWRAWTRRHGDRARRAIAWLRTRLHVPGRFHNVRLRAGHPEHDDRVGRYRKPG